MSQSRARTAITPGLANREEKPASEAGTAEESNEKSGRQLWCP